MVLIDVIIVLITFTIETYLVELVPPTSNIIHQNLVGGEFKFNRCPDHNDHDDDDDGDDDDDDGDDDDDDQKSDNVVDMKQVVNSPFD